MRLYFWAVTAAVLGVNFLGLLAVGLVLVGRARTSIERRAWAVRCAASALALVALSILLSVESIARSSSSALEGVEPSERATQLARGISEAMNCVALGVVGSTFPFFAALGLFLVARRAGRGSGPP